MHFPVHQNRLLSNMWGWASRNLAAPGAAQQVGLHWSSQAAWGASQAPAAPTQAPAATAALPRSTAAPPPLLPIAAVPPPPSRSGVAALAAERAAQQYGGPAPDPFAFDEAAAAAPAPQPPRRPAAPVAPAGTQLGGWRGRSTSFLLGGSSQGPPAASAAPPNRQQQAQPAPARAPQRRAPRPVAPPTTDGWPAAPAPPAPAPAPAAAAAKPAAVPLPPVSCTLSLDRYLEFFQLLTKGSGRVQFLGELERSVIKAADLKQASCGDVDGGQPCCSLHRHAQVADNRRMAGGACG